MALVVAILAGWAGQPMKAPSLPPASATVGLSVGAAADADRQQKAFERWVTDFRTSARAAGIDEVTLNAALADVRCLPSMVELDRAQPEFTRTVWNYLDSAVSPQRIVLGQERWREFRTAIDAAAARYGVTAAISVAIWGVESNYGSNFGSISTIDALAALGFDGRREDWARGPLLAALKILQNGDIDRSQMMGSRAGAMGQTQFLPSVFLAYAVDADGDGRRDIWGSMADVMASTANFLARSGWRADQPLGVEIRLPSAFDAGRADVAVRQPSAHWAVDGVRTSDGAPLPQFAEATFSFPRAPPAFDLDSPAN